VKRHDEACFGDAPGLADICLIPQLVNARRFGVTLTSERILEIEAACLEMEAFQVPGE
jgi:maleylpyruvate isomerase